jgi:hypothetical protein
MSRNLLLKIHLYLSAFFAPYLLLMAFTGTSYLFGFKGSETKELVKTIEFSGEEIALDNAFVRQNMSEIDGSYSFETVKESGTLATTRPATRQYYSFEKKGEQILVNKVYPNLLKRLIEAHKGHGPALLKSFEKLMGFSLILILISGIWLALSLKRDSKQTWILMTIGGISFLTLFLSL